MCSKFTFVVMSCHVTQKREKKRVGLRKKNALQFYLTSRVLSTEGQKVLDLESEIEYILDFMFREGSSVEIFIS